MCHGMGLTASAVGERITLVWSLTEPQWGLDLTSLSALARPAQTGSRSATEAAAAVAMELAAALARPTQTGSRSATEAAAAAVGMEPAAALLWFFELARCLVRDSR